MKKFWKTLGVLGIAGLFLMGASAAFGANTSLYWGKKGFEPGNNTITDVAQYETEPIENISITGFSSLIEVLPGDSFGYTISSSGSTEIAHSLNNGILSITEKQRFGFFVNVFSFHKNMIRIYLPADTKLDTVFIKTASGVVQLKDFTCDTADISAASGNISLQNVHTVNTNISAASGEIILADSTSALYDFKLTSGKIIGSNIYAKGIQGKIISGSVSLAGDLQGINDFSMTSGNLNLQLDAKQEDYNRSIRLTSGKAMINGLKAEGTVQFPDATNQLNIKATSGSIQIRFNQ